MTSRLPSRAALANMSDGNRHAVIEWHAIQAESEHCGLKDGVIVTVNGLKRVRAVANEFGVTI